MLIKTDDGLIPIIHGTICKINNENYKIYKYENGYRKYKLSDKSKPRGRPFADIYSINTDEGRIPLNNIKSGSIHKINGEDYKVYLINSNGKIIYQKNKIINNIQ